MRKIYFNYRTKLGYEEAKFNYLNNSQFSCFFYILIIILINNSQFFVFNIKSKF